MLDSLRAVFSEDFLLRDAFRTALLGLVAPLAGSYLLLRRSIFLAVALPQISAAGLAAGMLVSARFYSGDAHALANPFSLAGVFLATFGTLALFPWLHRRLKISSETLHAAGFALAGAAASLFLAHLPHAGHAFAHFLRGEIVSVDDGLFHLALGLLLPSGLLLFLLRHRFWQSGSDPNFSTAAGLPRGRWETALSVLVGLVLGTAVFLAGPLTCLGLMIFPALAAHRLAPSMGWLLPLSALLGLLASLAGFVLAYHWDLPTGAVIIAANGLLLLPALFRRR